MVAIAGGWQASSIDVVMSYSKGGGGIWGVIGINYAGTSETLTAQATCAG
jgi:hypothetical protein